ncbi:LysR family transcriptional regulator [Tateyamaria omphalii]|uniref:LysR family transcriptional regulator n=1 Tax=Tateyamaria omphalii TaxID=299262 RepID=UPI001672025F|nr:LysR family transcriptional regulator [Tateyamaria omphalii]GGX59652.1 LysR family transcriptional regulator [Tateyamaria omphalii]
MQRRINLIWLRSFEAAARLLNFTAASEELGLTQTAVSLHIRSLEEQLGSKLFHRRARHLSLTDIGQAYVSTVRQAIADIDLASVSLFGPMTARMVTVKAPVSTSVLWLAPRLPRFKQEHPEIDIRLVSDIWSTSTGPEGIDVEVRMGRGTWTDARSEKLSEEFITPICAAKQRGCIKGIPDLLRGPLIHILGYEGDWNRYFATHDCVPVPETEQYFLDTTVSAMQLVAGGHGYAMVLSRLAQTQSGLAAGIVPVGEATASPQSHYLMYRNSSVAVRPEIELFEAWLRAEFAQV